MTSRRRGFRWWLVLAVASLLCGFTTSAQAQVASGYSEYYIPGNEDIMWQVFDSLDAAATTPMHAIISVTAWSQETTVYYDHWEDGYDFVADDPATADEEVLLAAVGAQRIFESAGITLPRPTPPVAACSPAGTCLYDGGDRIYVAGGVVTVTRASYIESVGVGNQAAAWEIYPVKPQLTTYILPFGENLGFADFNRVYVLVQATADNTTFTVDLDGNGTADLLDTNRDGTADASTVTLSRGETFLLDRVSANTATLDAGAVIAGSSTLQVKFVAGNPGQNYCARGFSAFPRGYWTKDYYAPLDQPNANGNTDYYLYNPNAAAITITAESQASFSTFSIPANSVVSFRTATGGAVPVDSGLYFKGSDYFWGVGVGDAAANAYEWGFSLLPSTMLFQEHYLGWAPGSLTAAGAPDITGDPGNQDNVGVFLSVAQDNTRVWVDFNNDGAADNIDADLNGSAESPYVTLNRLQTQFFYDNVNAAGGGDLSQAHFWATGPFTMAYGENADTATASTPSLDLGYVAIPGTDFISLVLTVDKQASPVVVAAAGGTSTFTLTVDSQKYSITGVGVVDTLAAGWVYTGPTTITLPDMTTLATAPTQTAPGAALPATIGGTCPAGGGNCLSWDSAVLGSMAENQRITISFVATAGALAAGTMSQNRVRARGTRTVGGQTQTFNATDFAYNVSGAATITKSSNATDPVAPGDTITYTVVAANPGLTGLTNVSLYDAMPAGLSYVAGSGSTTCAVARNVRDGFAAVAYDNNGPNNTDLWAGDWAETDIAGSGAARGAVRVAGGVLRLARTVNVRDEFATAAYTNNGPNNTDLWAGDWTETDASGSAATGSTGGFVYATGTQMQFRYVFANVRDQFGTAGSYAGTDGSVVWSATPWAESNDDASAATGSIQVTGGQARFFQGTANRAIARSVSVVGATTATIQFLPTDNGFDAGETIVAEYSIDGGGFVAIGTYDGNTGGWNNVAQSVVVPLAGNNTLTVRFRAPGTWNAAGDQARIDNVDISFNVPANAVGTQIQRTVNLSGAASASLSFTYASAGLAAAPADTLVLEASPDGATFTTLATFTDGVPDVAGPYNILAYASAATTIRFRVTGGFDVVGKTFSVDNVDITYAASTPQVQRTVDLSGATTATLSFTTAVANLEAADTLVVEASTSAAGPFTTLATYAAGTPTPLALPSLTPYISAATTIRFRITGGYDANNEAFSIDNANIAYTTSRSGSAPNFLDSSLGCPIAAGGTLTLTFDATVNDPFPSGVTSITNTASTTSTQLPIAISASVTNTVLVPSALGASAGGRVWFDIDGDGVQDLGEPGKANYEVTLKDQFGTPVGSPLLTDGNGRFLFTGVQPGPGYYVEVTDGLDAGLTQSFPAGSTDDRTTTFDLSAGDAYARADIGYRSSASTASFGDQVWVDADLDGVRDSGEIGLGGVDVTLYLDDGDGVLETGVGGDTDAGTTTTAPDGTYLFTGVSASGTQTYFAVVTTPADYLATTDTNHRFDGVAAGGAYLTADFGFRGDSVATYSIRDRVWTDTNGNGAFDGGESGLAGVSVELLDSSLNVIGTTFTAADGSFTFSGMTGGGSDYTVRINDTGGVLMDYYGTTSYAVANKRLESNLTAAVDRVGSPPPSFGYRPSRGIGDLVFNDIDGDGAQDAGDLGFAGVLVSLYADGGVLGVVDGTDAVIRTVTTDAYGQYLFSGLPDGNYLVSAPVPSGTTFTGPGSDSDAAAAGVQKAATIAGGVSVLDRDFGFRVPPASQRTVGGTIWADADADGVVDGGESGIAGLVVNLYSDLDGDGVIDPGDSFVGSLTTDSAGAYSFAGLAPGSFIVEVTDPASTLTGYSSTFEQSVGTAGPFNYLEPVDLSVASVADLNFGFKKPKPTYAAIAFLTATLEDGAVVVTWRTSLEVGTAGFHLLRRDPDTGEFAQLNETLLPGLIVHPQGGTYRFVDAGAPQRGTLTYKLVEVETRGELREYGPYTVSLSAGNTAVVAAGGRSGGSRSSRKRFERLATDLSAPRQDQHRTRIAERQATAREREERSGTAVRIATRGDGLHYLSADRIASLLGLSVARTANLITTRRLRLANSAGVVPYLQAAGGTGIHFYAEALASIYADENVYWLFSGKGLAVEPATRVQSGSQSFSFAETLLLEEEHYPLPVVFNDPDADFWCWDYVFAGYPGLDSKDFVVRAPGVAGTGAVTLRVRLVGGSDSAAPVDHHVAVRWNGADVGEARWDGTTARELIVNLPGSAVLEGDNTLGLVGLLDAGVAWSVVYLDEVELSFQRLFRAEGDELSFAAPSSSLISIGGFSSPQILLLDVTSPGSPALVTQTTIVPVADGTYQASLVGAAGRRYLATTYGSARTPTGTSAYRDARLRDGGNAADYLLIAPAALSEAAQTLADYRMDRGLRTQVVELESIYDEFNGGVASPEAIRSFLRHARSSWARPPRFATLVGRGTYDFKDVRGYGDNLVPPLMASTDYGLVVSDSRIADLDGEDGIPEIALGRLPVVTAKELQDYVAKIQSFEATAANPRRVLMAADDPDESGSFNVDSDAVASHVPIDFRTDRVYLPAAGAAAAKQAIVESINGGVLLFNYVGHGGFDRLAHESLFSSADVPLLTNAGQLPVFLAMTCSVGNFGLPGYPSLGETMLLSKVGGSRATWAPAGLSDNAGAIMLDEAFFRATFVGGETVLGEIIAAALREYVGAGGDPSMKHLYNLLGEPVSELP